MPDSDTRVLITGGGTAGHVLPGIAIARELLDRGLRTAEVHFVGSERGVERRLVPGAGFSLTVLPGRGIQRRLTVDNIGAIAGLCRAIGLALKLIRRRRPEVVVSLGGYASIPCAVWAIAFRIPIVVAEQNAVPGIANRIVGRFAKTCGVSFEGTDLPRAVWTGNPVRAEILALDRADVRDDARRRLGLPLDRFVVAVFGGSLGALRINNAVLAALITWRERTDLAVRHVIGRRDFEEIIDRVPLVAADAMVYQPLEYEDDMASLYGAADLVVCRAGATSVAELAILGLPSVLVPLPGAPGDHQTANALALVNCGAAVLVADTELDGPRLVAEVDALLNSPERCGEMSVSSHSVARSDAAERLVDLVFDQLSPRN